MFLTNKARYAVMAMLEIATRETSAAIKLSEIAKVQEIELQFLEQIFAKLKKAELVEATRGPGGGYKLARDSKDISVADIISSVEEEIKMTRCSGTEESYGCLTKHKTLCATHHLWANLEKHIDEYLSSKSLFDLYHRNCMPKLNRIFLDHNATTPMLPAVKEAMFDLYQHPLNASSVHANGRAAKHYLELARQRVRAMIGADDSYHVIFTSSGTESNNLALTIRNSAKIVSVLEHSSILSVAKEALIPATRDGMIDLEALEALLSSGHYSNPLISVMLANNETGVIQPIEEVKNLARKYKCLLHTDATQAPGKIAIDINGIDMMTISAHKFGGPIGVAALICKKDLDLQPLVVGGGQEYRIRSGTHNIQAIHGLGIACELEPQYRKKMQLIKILRDNLEQQIQIIARNAIIFGAKSPRLPNTTSIGMLSVTAEAQLIHFDMNEIAVSAGSACSSGTAKPPHVHMAMGYDYNTAKSAIRVSLGINSTQIEIDKFIASWQNLYARAYDNNVMKKVI